MFKNIRILHLYVFLLLGASLIFYAISGAAMKHSGWFPQGPSQSTKLIPFDTKLPPSGRSKGEVRKLNRRLSTQLHLRGRLTTFRKRKGGSWFFVFERPGTIEEVTLRPREKQAWVVVRKDKFAATLARLHHLHGFKGGGRFLIWGILLDIVSISLLLFAASGIYLWLASKRNRLAGWIILGGSTFYVVGSLLFLLIRA